MNVKRILFLVLCATIVHQQANAISFDITRWGQAIRSFASSQLTNVAEFLKNDFSLPTIGKSVLHHLNNHKIKYACIACGVVAFLYAGYNSLEYEIAARKRNFLVQTENGKRKQCGGKEPEQQHTPQTAKVDYNLPVIDFYRSAIETEVAKRVQELAKKLAESPDFKEKYIIPEIEKMALSMAPAAGQKQLILQQLMEKPQNTSESLPHSPVATGGENVLGSTTNVDNALFSFSPTLAAQAKQQQPAL
jgi:hypothetical protein